MEAIAVPSPGHKREGQPKPGNSGSACNHNVFTDRRAGPRFPETSELTKVKEF
jgi:hypothetical protein